ncbi:hypothetical protein E4K67_29030 [Desulfosporosinus fructosivorans]|uniref:WxL domain-containing protein n=1 Tax=Desulfosporosinus fructosivorans TaxID=2018669 RepID=A0A4Z0QVA3_9FIRM|nr:hypothetical protein [Desulfosporosinus fructosivorans]TGE34741.1 hypothetical protein E4K67_29030 [Desulfosporosinus fructosivorans]
MIKKLLGGILITSVLLTQSVPVFAKDKVVYKGDGYTITVADETKKQDSASVIQPQDYFSSSMSQGATKTFTKTSEDSISFMGNVIKDTSNIKVISQHNLTSDDYITLSGYCKAYMSGTDPWSADSFTISPSETINSSALTLLAINAPGGVSVGPQSTSVTCDWADFTREDDYNATDTWKPIKFKTAGHFTSVQTNDQILWSIGGDGYNQATQIDISIN